MGRARRESLVQTEIVNIRDFSEDRHKSVDDAPYGGGEGMILKADVLYSAWRSVVPRKSKSILTVFLSPQGEKFDQAMAKELVGYENLVLVSGHYEGVDERFIETCVDREISVGDYVLTGGELPSLVVADTVIRLLPGVVGNPDSVSKESFEDGLLKYPQYTRPPKFQGQEVPEVLTSGNHSKIQKWRESQALERTRERRPELYSRWKKSSAKRD